MPIYVVDIETDGLVSEKIHVMSVGYEDGDGEWQIQSTWDYNTMIGVMSDPDNIIVGHNFKMFDAVELERVLDFKIKAFVIDTLPLAWYLYTQRRSGTFGLAAFGEDYGIEKPEVEDYKNLPYKVYEHRCEEDVKINVNLWIDLQEILIELYGSWELALRFIRYFMFKMDCVVHQQLRKCKVSVNRINKNIDILTPLGEEKEEALKKVMPPGKVIRTKPKIMYKKDKSISAIGQKWFDYLRENNLPIDTEEVRDVANPNSPDQLKDWLFGFDWKPEIFNDGANGPVPQIRNKKKQLCKSILRLAEKEPTILHLDGLTVINHRLGLLKSFLSSVDQQGFVIAGINPDRGFTNTLRLRHRKPIANLPKVKDKINKAIEKGMNKSEAVVNNLRDGQIIREVIVAIKGHKLCGSDISSLEDQTKRHYMWDYDPDYVTEQMIEGYDPHLGLAVYAGALTAKQVEDHKLYTLSGGKEGTNYKEIRDIYKEANYSCIYGVGAPKLSRVIGLTVKESKKLIRNYWNRNWSIKHLPKDITTKMVNEQMWLFNPVSEYWYSLRSEKDIFSTLNQGTGAFVFDMWLKFMSEEDIIPHLQYHDEVLLSVVESKREETEDILKRSMKKVNDTLELNVKIEIDINFGDTYADVH